MSWVRDAYAGAMDAAGNVFGENLTHEFSNTLGPGASLAGNDLERNYWNNKQDANDLRGQYGGSSASPSQYQQYVDQSTGLVSVINPQTGARVPTSTYDPGALQNLGFTWSRGDQLKPGEITSDNLGHMVNEHGLYWKGWSSAQVADATTNLFGQMTDMSLTQSQNLAGKLYDQAAARADAEVTRFPAVSQRALDATQIASQALSKDMSDQFTANLDTYMPGWREKVVGPSGAISMGSADVANAFKTKIFPELSYNMLQTKALLQNASRPMLAGEVPMAVSLAAMRNSGNSYGNTSAAGRSLSARDLGLGSQDLMKLGLAGTNAASALQASFDKGTTAILGAPGEAAKAHAATIGQFMAPIVDSGSLYGGIMAGLNSGASMKPDQIFKLGMESYEGNLQSGMNLYGQLSQLAATQAATFNEHLIAQAH